MLKAHASARYGPGHKPDLPLIGSLEEKLWLMTRTRERQNYTSRLHTHTELQRPIMARKNIRPAKSTRNRRWNIPRRHINSRWKRINNPLTLLPSTARRKTNLPSVIKTQLNTITL